MARRSWCVPGEIRQRLGFEVADDGTFRGHGVSLVYQLTPAQGLGFGKGPFSHTRWDFTT
jgi:hypothetical protein